MAVLENRVGVVIPAFNSGHLVAEAAESASVCLGGMTNVVIVDDGTRDRRSRQTLARLEDDGFTVHRQPNAGVSTARNRGLGLLTTPYAFVLDSDDLLEPGAATIAADALDADADIAIVTGSGIDFTDDGDASEPRSPGSIGREDMRRWTMLATASAFRVEDWARVGGFPDGIATGEDWVFWLRLLRNGGRVLTSEAVFVRHRIHEAQTTARPIDPREPAKAANLVMLENPDLVLAHPDELLEELGRLRLTLAEYRHAYRHVDRAKAQAKRLGRLRRTRG